MKNETLGNASKGNRIGVSEIKIPTSYKALRKTYFTEKARVDNTNPKQCIGEGDCVCFFLVRKGIGVCG